MCFIFSTLRCRYVAESVKAQNSNCKVASSMPTLGISLLWLWEKHFTVSSQPSAVQLSG